MNTPTATQQELDRLTTAFQFLDRTWQDQSVEMVEFNPGLIASVRAQFGLDGDSAKGLIFLWRTTLNRVTPARDRASTAIFMMGGTGAG